ncbi:MAG: hypothetical protein LBI87_00165 [Candidatus Accumulibacter sp.]|jgi:hypothetical protein|nr:hypothetical protein [Accumulibacter sp.]
MRRDDLRRQFGHRLYRGDNHYFFHRLTEGSESKILFNHGEHGGRGERRRKPRRIGDQWNDGFHSSVLDDLIARLPPSLLLAGADIVRPAWHSLFRFSHDVQGQTENALYLRG